MATWSQDELIADRLDELCQIVDSIRDQEGASDELRDVLASLPEAMTIEEAHLFLSAD